MKTIELRPAHTFDCEECGRENFCRCIIAEPSEEERAEFQDSGEQFTVGHWLTAPEEVTCKHCGSVFKTEDMRAA